jgi:hypothetical protein
LIPVWPQQLIGPKDEVLSHAGGFSRSVFYLIRALFERTGGDSGLIDTVGADLDATGDTLATAEVLSNDYNEVLNAIGTGVVLAQLQPSQYQWVFNGTGGDLDVYPPPPGEIDALGVAQPYVLANGKTQIFFCVKLLPVTGGQFFRSLQLG